MPSPIPNWLAGTDVTAVTITPLTVAADGSFTTGTAQSLAGHLDEIQLHQSNTLESVIALDSILENKVIVASGTALVLIEILTKVGGCFLAQIGNGFDYCQASFARGGRVFTGTFVIEKYFETLHRGKSVGALSLSPCGIGASLV